MDKKEYIVFPCDDQQYFFVATECPFNEFCWCTIGNCCFYNTQGKKYILSSETVRLMHFFDSFEACSQRALEGGFELDIPLFKAWAYVYKDEKDMPPSSILPYLKPHLNLDWAYHYMIYGMDNNPSVWMMSQGEIFIVEIFDRPDLQISEQPLVRMELPRKRLVDWRQRAQNLIGLMYNNEGFADPRTFPSNAIDSIENAAYCGCSRHGDPACKSHGPKEQEKQTIE